MAETIRIEGIEEIARNLEAVSDRIKRRALRAGMTRAGKLIERDAKRRVPVRMGRLRQAIEFDPKIRARSGDLVGKVLARRGPNNKGGYYAHLVERGHKLFRTTRTKKYFIKHVPADPFMRPALETNVGPSIELIRRAVKSEVDRFRARG